MPGGGAPLYLAMKNSGDTDHLGGKEACGKPRHPFKGPTHRLTLGHSPWAPGEVQ